LIVTLSDMPEMIYVDRFLERVLIHRPSANESHDTHVTALQAAARFLGAIRHHVRHCFVIISQSA